MSQSGAFVMSSTDRAVPLNLQPVNGPHRLSLDQPDYMRMAAVVVAGVKAGGLTQNEVARALGLYDNDVRRLLGEGEIGYSARIVRAVLGIETKEVRLVVLVAPDSPPLPPILYWPHPLVRRGGTWSTEAPRPDFTLKEVADLAGCTLRTIQRYVKRGAIPIVELVPGRPSSHRLARVPEDEARAWAAWYRAKEVERTA